VKTDRRDAVHADQIRQHGGLAGLRAETALESALTRPRNKWVYDEEHDVATLAAAYGFALVSSHPYRGGNKRISSLAIATFLGICGCDFTGTDEDIVGAMLGLAAGHVSEDALASWIRDRISPSK
jgi:death-on-curing protein